VDLIRSICAVPLALFLLSSTGASAGDYSVAYAIDANGKNDTGKIETCKYDKACEIESANSRLSISLLFSHPSPDHSWVDLRVEGPPACCYFADAARVIYLDIKPGLLRVPIYEGKERRVNEFVQNKLFGVLYLEFSNPR
jgi:ribosomal protein L33